MDQGWQKYCRYIFANLLFMWCMVSLHDSPSWRRHPTILLSIFHYMMSKYWSCIWSIGRIDIANKIHGVTHELKYFNLSWSDTCWLSGTFLCLVKAAHAPVFGTGTQYGPEISMRETHDVQDICAIRVTLGLSRTHHWSRQNPHHATGLWNLNAVSLFSMHSDEVPHPKVS